MEVDAVAERAAQVRQEAVDALPHQAPARGLGRSLGAERAWAPGEASAPSQGRTGPGPGPETLPRAPPAPLKRMGNQHQPTGSPPGGGLARV